MTPKSYTVGNFKAIGPAQTLPLRPITLIFGKNSAGKSSVIQSLLLCRHALEKRSFDFTSTKRWGQTIDLGGFRQYVHRHEANRDVQIGFTFERSPIEKSNTPMDSAVDRAAARFAGDTEVPPWSFSYLNFVSEISVSFSVGLPPRDLALKDETGPRVKELHLELDGERILSFGLDRTGHLGVTEANLKGTVATLAVAHLAHRYVATQGDSEAADGQSLKELAERLGSVPLESNTFQEMMESAVSAYDRLVGWETADESLLDLVAQSEPLARVLWNVAAKLPDELRATGRAMTLGGKGLDLGVPSKHRLPTTRLTVVSEDEPTDTGTAMGSAMEVEALEDVLTFFLDDPSTPDDLSALAKAFRFDLELLVESVFESLRHWLLGTEYIGPYRSIPGRYFQIAEAEDSTEIDQGYRTLREIASKPELLRDITNLFQETLDSPYRLAVRTVAPALDIRKLEEALQRELEQCKKDSQRDPRTEIAKVLASHSDGKETKGVYLVDSRNETDVDFCDVGFGIGQVLPLIAEVASDRTGIVCIEQPEVHLHPKMQSNLADVFIRERSEGTGAGSSLYILETHSEHLILRLLRRIRETTRGKLPDGLRPIDPNGVSVAWIEAGKEGSQITTLEINDKGRFIDPWPAGFFEERLEEMF